jgi:hypothetical protein
MNLDDFADYRLVALDTSPGGLLFQHMRCGHTELLELDEVPVKFLMVKATEHHMEKHSDTT